ncbi:hypothetical protein [Roseobacter sp. S98]|uniref:hypothetical protein n=1 Tax=Roseobacter algicola (ex Choi et al. 2025) (nom. illeg.) TaxID=3092138 RepID=UPI0035C70337
MADQTVKITNLDENTKSSTAYRMAVMLWQGVNDGYNPRSAEEITKFLKLVDNCSQSLQGFDREYDASEFL